MSKITFVIGGCRSGKSRRALELAETISLDRRLFLATCVPTDAEMQRRVRQHREERGTSWESLEVPRNLARAVTGEGHRAGVLLIDCLTLWVSNLMAAENNDDAIERYTTELVASLEGCPCPVILVSNETGTGIVPENAIARRFRDLVGMVNQRIAAAAGRVVWMVAGIPVEIKKGNRQTE